MESAIEADINLLNINQSISSVCAGSLDDSDGEIMVVGTQTNLLAYDVDKNRDLFYKDVSRKKVTKDFVKLQLLCEHGMFCNCGCY
jgi:hypothetical protein